MADRRASVGHDGHDLELIARVAAGDGSPTEVQAAETLRLECTGCRELDADLRAIALSTRALATATEAVRAPRDFRITPRDAARLRGRRLGDLFPARLGGGLVALGLVGILFGSGILGVFPGLGSAGAAAPAQQTIDERSSGAPGAVFGPAQTAASSGYAAAAGKDTATTGGPREAARGIGPNDWFLIMSGVAIVAGIGILLAARNGRRAGP